MEHLKYFIEALLNQQSLDQLKMLRKLSKGIDIGDRIDGEKNKPNMLYMENPIDSHIETYEEFNKKNKDFIPGWNAMKLKSPFKNDKNH